MPVAAVTFSNLPFVFLKKVSGIHSPAMIRSMVPSLLKSVHTASQTMPIFSRPLHVADVISVNFITPFLESLRYIKELTGVGYLPGRQRPPIKRSRSPSLSKSAALTQLLLVYL